MSIRPPFELVELALFACLALGAAGANASPRAAGAGEPEDPLAQYREQFKTGMDRYKEGAVGEAIARWEPIFSELGPVKGYRLAYDLGVAYGELGDATRSAERLQAFLAEVDARRARGEVAEPAVAKIVAKEEGDGRARLAKLVAEKGRIHVDTASATRVAQVDANEPRLAGFVAWVSPGEHRVVFDPGTPDAETRTLHVDAGAIIDVAPRVRAPEAGSVAPVAPVAPAGPRPLPPEPAATASPPVPPPLLAPTAGPGPESPRHARPASLPVFIAIGGGLTVASVVAAIPLESHASTLRGRFTLEQVQSPDHSISTADRQAFATARMWAYTAVGGAVGLGVVTTALTAWYVFGAPPREPGAIPSVAPEHGGASLRLAGHF